MLKRIDRIDEEQNITGKDEKIVDAKPYSIKQFEVHGKIVEIDGGYVRNEEGLIKVIEIALTFLALLLSGNVQGVSGERGFAMFVCGFAFVITIGILIAKVLTLNHHISSKYWFIMEAGIYILLALLLIIAAILMAVLCAQYWAEINPEWQTLPALASGALIGCAIVYIVDTFLIMCHRRYRTWTPSRNILADYELKNVYS
uniref:MARVEL domain-containing protein n=2 Tax=Acrobeloides nanus TaxID=290746 RepID=A0A914DGY6_9BILA